MATTVTKGLYFGFTRDELNAELERYKEAVKQRGAMRAAAGGGMLGSGDTGGAQVSFVYPEGVGSMDEWRQQIESALAELDGNDSAWTDRAKSQFR